MRLLAAWLLVLWSALPLRADDLPHWQSATVNDFAALISATDAARLEQTLRDLRDETGVQGTVVTLADRARYAGAEGLDPFAKQLFNQWGVGDAARNDGFMVLVLRDTREARIELGRGYQRDADLLAQNIMQNTMLPAFRRGEMSRGIVEGTQAIIDLIARPVATANPAAPLAKPGRKWLEGVAVVLCIGFWAAIIGAIALRIWRRIWRRHHCPQCGKSGLVTAQSPQETPQPGGGHAVSDQAVTRRCPHCGWSQTRLRPIAQTRYYGPGGELLRQERNPHYRGASASGGRGFGGGSSRGGGASGRW